MNKIVDHVVNIFEFKEYLNNELKIKRNLFSKLKSANFAKILPN